MHALHTTPYKSLEKQLVLQERNPNLDATLSNLLRSIASQNPTNLHTQTLMMYKLGFNQNFYTFTLILPINIVLRVVSFLEENSQIVSLSI